MTSRISTHLDAIETWLKALEFEGAPLVTECRRQLDLLDAEDISTQSFQAPSAFLVLPRWEFTPRADGGRDLVLQLVIGIATRRDAARPADVAAIERAIAVMIALDDQDFGQSELMPPQMIEARPLLAEAKGMAIAGISFRQTLLRVVPPPAAVLGLVDTFGGGGQRTGDDVETGPAILNADILSPEEQAVVEGWGPA